MPDRLLFVTSNPGKVREVAAIVGAPIAQLDLDLPEIQAIDVTEVARHKARTAFEQVGRPVLVEDTGLYVDALGDLPGAFVRWFLASLGPAGICALLPSGAARTARARTVVALCAGDEVEVFAGETPGEITQAPVGDGGFGWDAIFRPDGSERTFAQMDAPERAHFSMRRLALEHLRDRIQTIDPPTAP